MTECVFTLDYEIYGNGAGSLADLVIQPTKKLAEIFRRFGMPFVVFPEAVEFQRIEEAGSDPDSGGVRAQLRELRSAGHEIGLHLHPWWANARFERGEWLLDWSERNICSLPLDRVDTIVSRAVDYLRAALQDPAFVPLSFRSGLWVMQPTATISAVLARHGVRLDSSVFRGGRVGELGLDYRSAPADLRAWRFSNDVTVPDANGSLWEVPIHTEMVPFWRMLGRKRLGLQKKVPGAAGGTPLPRRWADFARFRYPRKLDFCRMTFEEMRAVVERMLRTPTAAPYRAVPVVVIGHSKDLVDFAAIDRFLNYLRQHDIAVVTFASYLSSQSPTGS
ncbi:MAG TPA: hypothetical protein PLN93_00775 [Vicinamibacterales bacterium]|nr:hypothetical protein [Vicinamibacterales bacterium]HPK70448.1 hypothetical protein [Vicinamibacterales bacterium]